MHSSLAHAKLIVFGGGDLLMRLCISPRLLCKLAIIEQADLTDQATPAAASLLFSSTGSKLFLTDAMSRRLTKWLRCAGFDTEMSTDYDAKALGAQALASRRVVITCSSKYAAQLAGVPHLLLHGRDVREQFLEVAQFFELSIDPESFLSRCTRCNAAFGVVEDAERLRGILPSHVFERVARFWQCPLCARVVWKGTQFKRVVSLFEDLYGGKNEAILAARAAIKDDMRRRPEDEEDEELDADDNFSL